LGLCNLASTNTLEVGETRMAVPLETRCRGTRCTASLVLSILGCLLDPHRRPSIVSIRAQPDQINESQSTVALYSPLPLAVGVFVSRPPRNFFASETRPVHEGSAAKASPRRVLRMRSRDFVEKSLHSPNLGRGSNHGFPARNPRMGAAQRVSGLGPSRSVTGFLQSARLERSSPAAPDGTSFQNVPLEWARGGSWRRRPIAIEIHGLRLRRPLFASRRSSHRHIVTGWRSLGANQIVCFIRSPMPRWIAAWDRGIVLEPR
jgi:hypothetical protein